MKRGIEQVHRRAISAKFLEDPAISRPSPAKPAFANGATDLGRQFLGASANLLGIDPDLVGARSVVAGKQNPRGLVARFLGLKPAAERVQPAR
jgi:hypothetical protein